MPPQPVTIDTQFLLGFVRYCVIVIGIGFVCLTILGGIAVWKAGKEAITPALHLITQGDALRMLTVIFIVGATTLLVAVGKIEGASAATIFSGVAGYVLGSGAKGKRTNKPESESDETG